MDTHLHAADCGHTAPRLGERHARPATRRGEARCAARLARIGAYIDAEVTNPDLSAHGAARALGMSVRAVHLVLASTGGSFGDLVKRRRLAACQAMLSRPDNGATIAATVFESGFNSLSTYYRAMRRAHGTGPHEITRRALDRAA